MVISHKHIGLVLLGAAVLSGCGEQRVQVSPRPSTPVTEADKMELWLTPGTPVNWDERPGPDGLLAQLRFYRMDQPLSVLVEGTIEFHLFDERVADPNMRALKPAETWKFTQADLENCMTRSLVGWGYKMRLAWQQMPTSRMVTLAAVYTSPDGKTLWSAPIHVPVGER